MIRGLLLILIACFIYGCGSTGGDTPSPQYTNSYFNAPQLISPSSHGGGIGWSNSNCIQCHTADKLKIIHRYNPNLYESFKLVGFDRIGACLYCHNTNGLTNITADSYECTFCHTNKNIVKTNLELNKLHFHDLNRDGKIDNSDCLLCHKTSNMNGKLEPDIDFNVQIKFTSTTDFCLNCHNLVGYQGIVPKVLKYDISGVSILDTFKGIGGNTDTADVHGYGVGVGQRFATFRGSYTNNIVVGCLECHNPHASNNPYLISESGNKALLTDNMGKNASIRIVQNNFSELCAICHKAIDVSAPTLSNGLQEVTHLSPYSDNCTECHYHGAGFSNRKDGLF